MFNRPFKKGSPGFTKHHPDLFHVLKPNKFLAEGKRNSLIDNMRKESDFDEQAFDTLCLSLIHHLIQSAQSLPETLNSYYSQPGGLIDFALNRTEAALSLFREYFIQSETTSLSDEQKLWLYALFSAGILQGSGKLQMDFKVELFDLHKHFLKRWEPLIENMTSVASFYHYEFLEEGDAVLRQRLNTLLARQLMPSSGFAWLITNPRVLAVWLALLNEDVEGAGVLGAILIRAEAIAIQRYLSQHLLAHGSSGNKGVPISTFIDTLPADKSEKETQVCAEFIQWLVQQLREGKIMVNRSPLFSVPGGLLMSTDIFKYFIREHPGYKAPLVQKAFLNLDFHRQALDGSPIVRIEQAKSGELLSGILVEKYAALLPDSVQVYEKSGQTKHFSALEFIQAHSANANHLKEASMVHLSARGEWQNTTESNRINLKGTFRG